jgi:hypothetical protein
VDCFLPTAKNYLNWTCTNRFGKCRCSNWCPSFLCICYQVTEYLPVDFLLCALIPIKSYSNAETEKAIIISDNKAKLNQGFITGFTDEKIYIHNFNN